MARASRAFIDSQPFANLGIWKTFGPPEQECPILVVHFDELFIKPISVRLVSTCICAWRTTVRKLVGDRNGFEGKLPVKIDRLVLGDLENPCCQLCFSAVLKFTDVATDREQCITSKFFGVRFRHIHGEQ